LRKPFNGRCVLIERVVKEEALKERRKEKRKRK
jgi:hypothetical protein